MPPKRSASISGTANRGVDPALPLLLLFALMVRHRKRESCTPGV